MGQGQGNITKGSKESVLNPGRDLSESSHKMGALELNSTFKGEDPTTERAETQARSQA